MVAGFVNALFLIFIAFFIFSEAIEVHDRRGREGVGGTDLFHFNHLF